MCIAIYSPMGTETPNETFLKTSFENNPDGAGFAFNDNGRVRILKGFMTWDAFLDTYRKYHDTYDFKNRGVLIHFRITTHGGTCPECTHPFPLTSDAGMMHKLESTSEYAVIHNGIISLTSAEAHAAQKMSDTMVFVSKYMSKIAQYKGWFDNPVSFELFYDLAASKIAVLRGDGSIHSTYGFAQDEGDGNFYSNTSYKEARVKYPTTYPAYSYTNYRDYRYDGYVDPYDDDDDMYGSYDSKTGKWTYEKKKKKKSPAIALMKLAAGSLINIGSMAYSVDKDTDAGAYFVDGKKNVYFLWDSDFKEENKYIKYGLTLFDDNCEVTDANGTPLAFKADYWADADNIN